MGNCWTGINDDVFLDSEKKVLEFSGIPFDQFDIQNVVIDDKGNYIRTIQVGDRSKQKLVIIHGYGGSGVMFYKIMKPLAEHYHCIYIDILGMGGSSRPKFSAKTQLEADDFLSDWLERWRVKMGNLTGFVLAGHSFGGYVAGVYACRYHQHIKKLLLLSPAGISKRKQDFDLYEELKDRMNIQKRKMPPKCLVSCCLCCFSRVWKCKCSPFGIMRCCGKGCTNRLMRNFIKNRFSSVPKDEMEIYKVYLKQTLLRKGSSEYAIFVCFDHLMFAFHPLEDRDRVGGLPIPVSVFFGDFDWMYSASGEIIVNRNPFKDTHSKVYIVENSDHHMYFDNPEDFANKILIDLSNLDDIGKLQDNVLLNVQNNDISNNSSNLLLVRNNQDLFDN